MGDNQKITHIHCGAITWIVSPFDASYLNLASTCTCSTAEAAATLRGKYSEIPAIIIFSARRCKSEPNQPTKFSIRRVSIILLSQMTLEHFRFFFNVFPFQLSLLLQIIRELFKQLLTCRHAHRVKFLSINLSLGSLTSVISLSLSLLQPLLLPTLEWFQVFLTEDEK